MTPASVPFVSLEEISRTALPSERSSDIIIVDVPMEKSGLLAYPSRLESNVIGLCTEGEGEFTVNLDKHALHAGMLFFLPAQSIVQLTATNSAFRGILVGLKPALIDRLPIPTAVPIYSEVLGNPTATVPDGEVEYLTGLLEMIRKHMKRENTEHRRETLHHLIIAFLCETGAAFREVRIRKLQTVSHGQKTVKKLMELIMENYRTERQVDFYADRLCLTPKYLSSVCKRITGRSVSEWIRIALILDAKMQLKHTLLTVQQISGLLNFPNPSFFGRFFRKHTGMTPLEFRHS